MTKADLPLLSEKLLAATGGDREIDALIAEHFGEPNSWSWFGTGVSESSKEEVWVYWSPEGGGWWSWGPKGWRTAFESEDRARKCTPDGKMYNHPPKGGSSIVREASKDCPHYTADLSAAVALVEKCLPDATWSCGIQPKPYKAEATIYGPIKPWPESTRYEYGYHAKAPTPALALLCAFIAAMGEKT